MQKSFFASEWFRLRAGLLQISRYWSACHMAAGRWPRGWRLQMHDDQPLCNNVQRADAVSQPFPQSISIVKPIVHPPLQWRTHEPGNGKCAVELSIWKLCQRATIFRTNLLPWRLNPFHHVHAAATLIDCAKSKYLDHHILNNIFNVHLKIRI